MEMIGNNDSGQTIEERRTWRMLCARNDSAVLFGSILKCGMLDKRNKCKPIGYAFARNDHVPN